MADKKVYLNPKSMKEIYDSGALDGIKSKHTIALRRSIVSATVSATAVAMNRVATDVVARRIYESFAFVRNMSTSGIEDIFRNELPLNVRRVAYFADPTLVIKGSAIVGAVVGGTIAVVQDYSLYRNGYLTGSQFWFDVVTEGGIEATCGAFGAAVGMGVGSLIPFPVLGTLVGMAAGAAVGGTIGLLLEEIKSASWDRMWPMEQQSQDSVVAVAD